VQNIKKNRAGLTLIELILSIAIIGLIAVSFMPLFVMSAKTNSKSETTLDSTYLGKDAMELAYGLSQDISYEKLGDELVGEGYSKISDNEFGYEYSDNKYLNIKFTEEGNLIKVVVKIYKDMNQLEVQYESLYSWKGRGILSEE
jgi:prepilin-type N-terminal cleavage/methylation domain-containing protein